MGLLHESSAHSNGPGRGKEGGSGRGKGPQSKVTSVPKTGGKSNRGDGKSGRDNPKR